MAVAKALRLFLLTMSACLVVSGSALAVDLSGTTWERVAQDKDLDPHLLYAVSLAESQNAAPGHPGYATPWKWAVNDRGQGIFFDSRAEVQSYINEQLSAGNRNIDVSLMQINIRWHGHRVEDPLQLLETEIAIRVAADILNESIASAPGDIELGIGRYHHWRDESRARAYGRKVIEIYRQLRLLSAHNPD